MKISLIGITVRFVCAYGKLGLSLQSLVSFNTRMNLGVKANVCLAVLLRTKASNSIKLVWRAVG